MMNVLKVIWLIKIGMMNYTMLMKNNGLLININLIKHMLYKGTEFKMLVTLSVDRFLILSEGPFVRLSTVTETDNFEDLVRFMI